MYGNVETAKGIAQSAPRPTIGSSIQDTLERMTNCHGLMDQIEVRISGPRPAENLKSMSEAFCMADALDQGKGRIAALENRLANLLDIL